MKTSYTNAYPSIKYMVMKKGNLLTRVITLAVLFFVSASALNAQKKIEVPAKSKAASMTKKDYMQLLKETSNTISFIENKGQFDPKVKLAGNTNVGNMWVMDDQIFFQSLHKEEKEGGETAHEGNGEVGEEEEGVEAFNWAIFMEGMNPNFTVSKEKQLPTNRSYFKGNDPKYWAANVSSYGEVSLNNIYKGIDLRLYSQDEQHLEFDWLVEPGADYKQIKMRFKGQEGLRVDEKGNLEVQLEFDHVKFDIPEAYQIIDGKKVAVQIAFSVHDNVATFVTAEKIDNRYALVIDPSLKWGTWFDDNSNGFDQYLYAVDIDATGNVYCGGTSNQQFDRAFTGATTVYGYDSTFNDLTSGGTGNANNGYSDGIVYKISANGTTLMNITFFGASSPGSGTRTTFDEVYGLSLSPDFSTVYICGRTGNTGTNNLDIPLVGTPFDNARNGTTREGYVAKFNSSLTSLQYSSYIGGAGTTDDAMYSIHALSNTSFVVGGDVDGAVQVASPNYIVNAYDATYSGNDEMYIAKFSPDNTLIFGTYVGGDLNDHLNDIAVFSDGAFAFSGRTNGTLASFPGGATGVNQAASNGGNNNQDGVIGVIPADGGTFTMLSRIGGSGNDEFNGITIDPFDTLYISGTTDNNSFPLGTGASAANRLDNAYNAGTDAIIAKLPRNGKVGATDPWAATYFGGQGTDIANTLRIYTPYAIALFGTTTSAAGTIASGGFPVQNLADGGAFYQGTNNGGIDACWLVLGTDLKTEYFCTYVGGSNNDYLGATGVPRGSNQFVNEGDSLIVLGTTFHSSNTNPGNTGINPVVLGPTSGAGASFRPFTPDADGDDKHIIFKWRIGVLLNFDYSDAPASYGSPNHVVVGSLKLGSLIDKEDFPQPSYKAMKDDSVGTDDEDAISSPATPPYNNKVMIQDTSTRYSQVVAVTNTSVVTAMLMGWIDFNRNGTFDNTEVDTALVPPGATSATLNWSGYNAGAAYFNLTNDTSYMRLRITNQASFMVTNPSPTANAANGEVEDYMVIRFHCVNLSSATIDTNGTTGCGTATGSIVITNDTIYAGVQYGVYYSKDGGPLQGPFFYTTSGSGISGTLTISGLTAGTYSAIQTFHPTNPACGFTLPTTYTILDPTPPAKPGIVASATQICVNGSFTLTASGVGSATFAWSGPSGFTASTAAFTRTPATLAMTGSYCVHQTAPNGCVSTDSCITITVNPLPTLTASSNTPVCTGSTTSINLTSTPAAGTSPYPTFAWSGVGGFSAATQNATNGPPVTAGMAGAYNVTVTDSKGCTATATTSVVVNTSPSVAPTSNSPICSGVGKTLTLNANPTGTISTYSWSGPASFSSAIQNPSRTNALPGYSGSYTLSVTATNGCTATGNVNVTVNESPFATPSSNSPVCANATLSFNANPTLGTTPYTFTWSGPVALTNGTTQTPFVTNAQVASSGTYNVTVTSANTCTATASIAATVNPNPVAAPSSNSPICQGVQLNLLTNPSGGSGTFSTYNWSGPSFSSASQNPSITNAQPANSGTYDVTVTDNRGCTGTGSTSVTVNPNPTLTASSNSAVCAPNPLNLTSTPSGGSGVYSTYSWTGPSSYSNATQSPTRNPSTTAMTGTYNVTVTDNRGCTASATTNVTVNSTLVATASSNTPVCTGGTLNLSSTPNSAASYVWSGPASFSSNAQNPSRSSAIAGYAGTYNVVVTDGNGCSGSANAVVVVNSGISIAPNSNTPVCTGASLNLSSNVTGGTAPISYTWTGPNSFSNSGANPTIASAVIASGGTYNLTVSDVNGCSASGTTVVVINQSPSISASSNTPVCTGLTINLNSTPSSGTIPYRFTWSGPSSFVSQAEDTTRGTATLAMGGTYSVTVLDNNNCSATASTVVVINQSPSITASSNTPVCETLTLNLTSTPSSGTPGYTFAWGGPVTFSSASQNPSRSAMTLAMAGTYTVTVTDANLCTGSGSTSVSVTPKPSSGTASALPNPICTGNTLNLSVTGSGGTWGWNGPNSFTSASQNPSIATVTLAANGTYKVAHTVSGCTSDSASVAVVVNQTPGTPTAGASPNPICSGNTLNLTATGVGASWSWSGPNGFISALQNPTISSITTAGTGTYSVFQTINGCTSVAPGTVAVTVNQTPTAPSLSSNNPSCYGDTLKLFAGTVAGATYSWTGPGGFTSSLQNPVRPNATPAMNGTYSLNVTVLGCTSVTPSTVNVSTIVSCPPVAVNDAYSTNEDVTLNVLATGILVNDFDNSNPAQPLTLNTTPICNPAHGSVTINANGSFTYIPSLNYNGLDTFCYSICDNEVPVACDTAIVVITVVPVNYPPVVRDTTVITPEDNPITICLPITDPETATQLHILSAITCGPVNGIITSSTINNGSNPHSICITYSPNLNFNGSDSICIVICDNGTPQLCDNAVIHITVTPVNDKPVAVDDYFVSCVDTALKQNFMLNDGDVDGPSLQYSGIVFGPFVGTITSGPTVGGNFTFTPPVSFNGLDSFAYVICDNGTPNLCDTAVVILDYSCVNVPPIALNDDFTINEDQTLNNTVATNDVDPDGGILTYNTTPVVGVSHGAVTLNSNGTFTYVPNPNYFGSDSFVYSVCDNGSPVKCDTATVYITILPVNDPPFIPDTTITTGEDTAVNICLPITDIESFDLHVSAVYCFPTNGTLSGLSVNNISSPHQVCVLYSLNLNYNGTDSFCLIVCDNGTPAKCDTSIIHINVIPVNDPPIAVNDNYSTNEDVTLVTSSLTGVRNNDNDNADGNAVTTLSVTTTPVINVAHGTLTLSSDGHFTYIPTSNYCGTDSFQYRVCDNGTPLPSLCDTATAYITINCVNDPPVVIDTPITQCEDCGPITVCIPVTDNDPGQQHFISATFCGPNSGSLSSTLNGPSFDLLCVTYTPNVNFNGLDSICIIVCDNGIPSLCDTTHITITVTPVNDPPIAVNDNYNTNEDVTLVTSSVTGVRNNDNDNADGNAVTTLSVTTIPVINVAHGTLSLSSDGSFTYVPTSNYCGTDSFQYRVCDNGTPLPSLCDTGTAYITINCVNDPPVVIDTPITQCEDCGPITVCIPVTDADAGQTHFIAATFCGPNNGTVSSTLNGPSFDLLCVTYTPTANFNGNDSICIIVCDNGSPVLCDTTHITITVTPVNDPPIAVNDNYSTSEDNPIVTTSLTGVRNNDNDNADGNAVATLSVTTTPVINVVHGTLVLSSDGHFTYTPTSNYCGTDSFQYRVCDNGTPLPSLCDTATAYISITCTNDPPVVRDTTVTTPEDTPITVCIPISDNDAADIHAYSLCGNAVNGTSVISVNNGSLPHTVCVTYTPYVNFYGTDSICIIICDNGSPQGCDTSHVYINVTPVNDPPWADTIFVYTYQDQPVGVNVSGASGDPDGNPLTYTYGSPTPNNGVVTVVGSGSVDVTPNSGFTGTFTIPYQVCDLSPYNVNILCANAAIVVVVLPPGDTVNNHAPVANNDFATAPVNTPIVINVLNNDYDPDGDNPLSVTVTTLPNHGTVSVNPNGTINYNPSTGFSGYDTLTYTLCDPIGTTLPRPLCDQATVIISINLDPIVAVNDPPVAADDFAEICTNSTVTFHLLQNDYDQNGNAITSCSIIQNVTNGVLTNPGFGLYIYDPNNAFAGYDTLLYRICDNGTPSLCDTGMAVIHVLPNPTLTPNVASIINCSNDSVNILVTSDVPGTTITWTATNGTSGTGDVHTVLSNSGTTNLTVTYTFTGVSAGGCGSSSIAVPVTVRPRPIATAFVNTSLVCSGENVVINALSNIGGTTFAWFGSDGTSGTGNSISVNPLNNGTSTIVVNYVIIPTFNGCNGDSLVIPISVKPRPALSLNPTAQTVCSGTPITIGISSTVPGTNVTWVATDGNSGNTFTINDSPVNITSSNIVVTYTVNGSFNGCNANTVFGTVTVRPRIVADAGPDKTVTACSGSCVQIGGSPTGAGGSGTLTYSWTPTSGLSSSTTANPTACGILSNTSFVVAVTDAFGCSASDAMNITSSPSSLTAEAGAGGAFCLGSGDSVMLGGFPTAVGGVPAYTYTWAPSGLNLTNPANPWAFPSATTKYYLTVTDALGCTSIDSTIVTAYPQLFASAGTDTIVCAGFPANLGGNPTAVAGSGSGFTYAWAPTNNVSNTAVSNPTASPVVTTSYVVTVTDGHGCRASDTIQVVVRPTPTAQAGPDKTIAACPGDSVILGDNPAAIGGVPGYTYSWSPSTGIITSTTIANPVVKNLASAQTYTLVVTDANGCTSSDNITVNVSPNNLSVNAGNDKFICYGNSVQLGALPVVAGGTPPYVYAWVGGSLNNSTASNPVANPTTNTTYTVNVTDSKGCSGSDVVEVTVNPNLFANAGPDTTVCSGSSVVIGGSPSAIGGTSGYTYSWTPTIGISVPNSANPSASPITVTTYQLLVVDSKGCSSLDEVTVTPRTNPIADAGSDKILVNCSGDSTFIGGLPTVVGGGTPPYTCVWSPDFGLSQDSTCNPTVYGTAIGLGSHSYQLVVRDVYGCVGVDYMIVDVIPSTLQADAGNNGKLCSNSGGTITIGGNPTAAGGIAPFNFTWSGTDGFTSNLPNPQVSPAVTTTYYVTVMDSKGCTSTDSVKVVINTAPSANAGRDTILCSGFCVTLGSGSTGTGGTPPYQYLWAPTIGLNANNTPNPLACPLITTTFNVQVTDSNGCVINDAVTVTVRPVPVANAGTDASMTTCSGDSVRIGGTPAASGGTLGYTYSWSPAAGLYPDTTVTNPWVKGISTSGLYTLKVTDANGCTAEDAVAITVVPSTLSADAGNDGAYCSGSVSSVTLGGGTTAIGGAPVYTFSWSPSTGLSSTTVAHPVANPTTTQTYYVTVTDSKGCIAVDSVTVTVYPKPIANAGLDTAVCSGKPVHLGGEPTASSGGQGNGTFTYSWSPTIGLSSSTASNPTAITTVTTTYIVTVTNENGCTASDGIQVTIRANPIADAGPDKTLVACSADSVRLGGSPTASNGGGIYTYIWTPGTNPPLSNGTVANPYASHLGSTTSFTVVVTDQFGCSATDQVAVQVTNPTLIANAGNDVSFCQGASVSVTLGSTPTALGGTLPYTYSWSPGSTLTPDSTRANPVATPTATTTYTVVVRDATGCIASDTVRITINPRPVVSAGLPDTICAGECVVLGGSPTASAGTGSYTYSWTPSLFITGSTTSSNPTACPTSPITYQVTATDSLGCSNNASISIRVNQNPVANAGADKSLVACPEACVTIGGSPTASGGGGGYLYAWAPSAGLNNTGLPNPSACNLSQSVTYSLTLTDANGCTATDQVLVSVSQSTLRADAGPDKSICAGTTNCVSIGGINSVQGATGSYVIDWSPTGGICNANNIPNPLVNPTDTTTYVLLVTDSLGCVAIDSMVLFANPAVTASVEPDTAICAGASALLGGNPTGSGGTPNYTYSWSGGTLTNPTSGNPVASPVSTTSYCVTVTDKVGCSASTCQTVTVNQAVFADAGPDQSMTFCPGSYVIIGGSPTGAGGTGNFSYQWAPDSVGGVPVLFSSTIPNPIISGLSQTTTFTVTVTDNVTKCLAIDQVKVTVNQSTLTVDAGADKTFCSNSSSCVLIGGAPTASGGVFPYSYQWAPIGGLNDATIANPCAAPINTTMYHVRVYDNLGCYQEDSMTVVVSPLIVANAGNDTIICSNSSVLVGGSPSGIGGTGTLTYQWSPSTFLTSTVTSNPIAQNITSNITYSLKVSDTLGCSATDIINIGVRALPIANAGPNATITACSSDSAILGGSPAVSGTVGPYTYSWNPPVGLNNTTVPNPVVSHLGNTTQYSLVGTDTFGCSSLPSYVTVTVLPVTIIVDAGATQSVCSNVAGCVTLGGATPVNGGVGPYTFQWFGGALPTNIDHPTACPLATTTYTLVVTDDNGCQSSDTVQVIVNQPTEANISGLNSSYCLNSGNVVMTGIPSGGTFSGPFVTGNVFQTTAVGLWCVTYTYTDPSTGCIDDTSICVTVNALPVVTASGFNANYCRYDAPFTITGSPLGGTFSGSPGVDALGVFTPANATVGNNTITYTYLDEQTGCSNTYTFTINVKDAPTLDLSASLDTVCAAGCTTIDATYSIDVFNISYTQIGGGNVHSGLGSWIYCPTLADVSIVGTAVNTPNGCITRDTLTFHVNQPPVALYDEASTCEEIQVFIPELSNDSDPEGDNNAVTIISTAHGSTTVGSGLLIYTPAANFNGTDTILYLLCNTNCPNACDTGTVVVTVCPVNDPPVILDTIITIYENDTADVCPFIFDVDGDALIISDAQCTPLNGTIVMTSDSCFEFVPTSGWTGTQVLCIAVCDPSGLCDTATITINVIGINHRPHAVKVNRTVCLNTSIGINVSAGAGDIDGDPLNFSYLAATSQPAGSSYVLTVTGNGSVVFSGTAAGYYHIPYIVCDVTNRYPGSLCDTDEIVVRVIICDSLNEPPVANDDYVGTCDSTSTVINVVANDYDPDGDALNVTLLCPPSLGGATVTVNPNGTITYSSSTVGLDSICYVICDPYNACDTAVTYIYINAVCGVNHPPVAVDDFDYTDYATPVVVNVLSNDHDPDGNPISIVSIPCPPLYGTAVNSGGVITYTPGPNANANQPDTFCYVIQDIYGAYDTAYVVIYIKNSVQAINDTVQTGNYVPITINVMLNDFDPETDSFQVTGVITTGTVGTVTWNGDSTITYVPASDTCGFIDSFQYIVQDVHGAVDTATVYITINCCPLPVAVLDSALVISGDSLLLNPSLNDTGSSLIVAIVTAPLHGTATVNANGVVTYKPASAYCGYDTLSYSITNTCGADTGLVIVNVSCNLPPNALKNSLTMCVNDTASVDVLANDNDPDGNTLTITGFSNPFPSGLGQITGVSGGVVSFQSGTTAGTFSLNYYVCDNGLPSKCDTAVLIVRVVPCTPIHADTIYGNTCLNTADTICAGNAITGTNNPTITTICSSQNGTATLAGGNCIAYTPNNGFIGRDTFCMVVCDTLGHCDTSAVVMTTVDCLIQAVDEPCDLDTAYMNVSFTVDVLANDIIPFGGDTSVTLLTNPTNGTAVVNANYTVTYTPNASFTGTESFVYQVCVITGADSFCSRAKICITVVDSTVECYIPNGFSPNGDGVNEEFTIPCNSRYPQSTLRIFDRWGVEVWFSDGPYLNDFGGKNKQGTTLPDGTYYLIYEYNDGTGRREAKFVVINR